MYTNKRRFTPCTQYSTQHTTHHTYTHTTHKHILVPLVCGTTRHFPPRLFSHLDIRLSERLLEEHGRLTGPLILERNAVDVRVPWLLGVQHRFHIPAEGGRREKGEVVEKGGYSNVSVNVVPSMCMEIQACPSIQTSSSICTSIIYIHSSVPSSH